MLEVAWGAMMVTMGKWCGDCGDSTVGDGCEGQGGSSSVGWLGGGSGKTMTTITMIVVVVMVGGWW